MAVPSFLGATLRRGSLISARHSAPRFLSSTVPAPLAGIESRRFNDKVMEKLLDAATYSEFKASVKEGRAMDSKHGNLLASALQNWAFSHGATKFAHWFFPLRSAVGYAPSALKKESLIEVDFGDAALIKGFKAGGFSGNALFASETDGSSFPNGGLRATHTAAAFTGWDRTSPPFIRNDVLYLPATLISYKGTSLDEKTPLLRAEDAVNKHALRLLRALGDHTTQRVVSNTGCEQEFFIVSADDYAKRPDLVASGRTVLGRSPARGQQTSQHYFAPLPSKVKAFLKEVSAELWALGVSYIVEHNEVAPSQHEFSPVFVLSNVAADQNIMALELMNEVAVRHGLRVLSHEKPFKGVNGNGKHNNWGLNTDTGKNLLAPGKTEESQATFMLMVACLARAFHVHGDLLRVGVSSAGNDHRLGAHEAPPAIMSVYTGQLMEQHIKAIVAGGPLAGYKGGLKAIATGTRAVAPINGGLEDRNRTAPFPFCGNRFEFRAVGSSQNIAQPLSYLNTTVAESLDVLATAIEGGATPRDACAQMFKAHLPAIFNGNGYSPEWVTEAAKRGLPNLRKSVDAFATFASKKNIALFEKYNIFSEAEVHARQHIMLEAYVNTLVIEAKTMLTMLNTGVIPAMAADLNAYHGQFAGARPAVYAKVAKETEALAAAIDTIPSDDDLLAAGKFCAGPLSAQMAATRAAHDEAEGLISAKLYPFPTYESLLHRLRSSP